MNAAIFIYLAGMFEQMRDAILPSLIALIVFLPVFFLASFMWESDQIPYRPTKEEEPIRAKASLFRKKVISVFKFFWVPALLIYILAPTESTMYKMAGGYISETVITNPNTQRIASKTIALIERKIDEQLKKETKERSK